MKCSRRFFLGSMAAAAGVALADDKLVDGGFADVSLPGVPERRNRDGSPAPLVPPGAGGYDNLDRRCVGCQLCVAACPNKVLRTGRGKRFRRPEMGFEKGWCRPECTKCGEVCPTGAIRRVSRAEKEEIHIGHAIWHKDACIAAKDGVSCTVCERHCPMKAITLIPLDPAEPNGAKVPVVDRLRCIGCGACEHLCPARPMPGMTVKGFSRHRETHPMGDGELLAEARRLLSTKDMGCVLLKGGEIVATASGKGLKPILQLLDTKPDLFRGSWVVDKVIGRAAAAAIVAGGAARAYALTASEEAKTFLSARGIRLEADLFVPQIMNRDKTGLCPLEQSVLGLDEPKAMLEAIRARIGASKSV